MFVGHGLLAFALVALAADMFGWSRDRALAVGLLAGAFALAPDVDMLYAPVGVLGAAGVMDAATEFWQTGNLVHRAVTHSLVVSAVVAAGATAWAHDTSASRGLAVALAFGLVAVAFAVSGGLGAAIVLAFCVTAGLLAEVATRRFSFGPRAVAPAAAVGLFSHPFGDLLTGHPPAFLYPLDVTLVAERVTVFADPTLNLLAPLFLELATAWLALGVFLRVQEFRFRPHLAGRAAAGSGFAAAAFLLPAPTLEVSYHFVFGLLGVGAVLSAPLPRVEVSSLADLRDHPLRVVVTGLSAVTLAAVAYTLVYLGLGAGL